MRTRRTARQLELLDRLVDLMAAEGFATFTLDELAARLRCSKTTLYALAPTKHELVVEVVKQYFRAAVPAVEAHVERATDAAGRVQGYLAGVAEYLTPLSRRFIDDLSAFAPAAAAYRQNTAAAAERIRELINEGVESGEFRPVHASFVAEIVAVAMFEIQRGEMFERLELTDAEAYAELASLVVHALTPEPGGPRATRGVLDSGAPPAPAGRSRPGGRGRRAGRSAPAAAPASYR